MRRTLPAVLLASLASLAAACGDDGAGGPDAGPPDAGPPDAAVPPAFRNPVDLPDDQLALQALQLLGASVPDAERNCDVCHGLTRTRLRDWESLSATSMTDCLTNLTVTDRDEALQMVNCMRGNPGEIDSPFSPAKVGFYATAAHLDWFDYLFALAYPESGDDMHAEFSGRVLMPRGVHLPFTQGEFDIIAEWVARGLPLLDDLVPDNPKPGDCTEEIGDEVAAHVAAMATGGWGAVNAENGINMFGCAGAATTRDCLSTYPLSSETTYGESWATVLPTSQLRILRENDYWSAYWTRSSADGRYVAHGGDDGSQQGAASTIVDLEDSQLIGTSAFYDPGFFPDNSGFAFQGNRAYFCNQSMLATETFISYQETGCMNTQSVGLYQHLGAALGGGDYWTVDGQFESDSGGHQPTLGQPACNFDGNSDLDFVPFIHTGSVYQVGTPVSEPTPGEGDGVLSPSAGLVVTRVAGAGSSQVGFRLRQVIMTPSGGGYTVDAPAIGMYCETGGKPGFSFDERWMAIHHYVEADDAVELGFTGPSDPAFAPYLSQGAANVYLIDLVTGDKIRVTNMGPGQYALFPHFRSDDWMYFMVRVEGVGVEYIVASDAALLVGGE
jgi:hypothetical protein